MVGDTPTVLLDKEGRIIGILGGRPSGDDWDGVAKEVSELLRTAESRGAKPCKQERRGKFVPLTFGVSYGGGQPAPGHLCHNQHNLRVIEEIKGTKAIKRVAGFMSSCFATYSPKLFKEYHEVLGKLFEAHPHLKRNFSNSVFPTATFNCGDQVVTLEHVDSPNVPFGLCAIFACGSYDPTLGGHLILFDLNIVIEFPPGSTILIPSGTLRHGNVAVRPEETRQSFTQFCPGGLFRWVAYGFKPASKVKEAVLQQFRDHHKERCHRALGLFSKVNELWEDRRSLS
ncbi:hypothetical protein L210DRAFT_3659486 [Boletus edulis BED1]|uniref:Uncharacterized protein n=1 Tax=Boletus edulis BED1 TaxID=1328754 RepID=A0AAD4G5H3_BOLED|nr:hypothetical protein L210DRAFT_3659486 [Boletus edulis BED1]